MSILIDTALDSRITVLGSAEEAWAKRWLSDRGAIAVSSITVYERTFGFASAERTARSADEATRWRSRLAAYRALISSSAYQVYPLTGLSGFVAGILYAQLPSPPPAVWTRVSRRRRDRAKSKTEVRRAWLLDVLIAATALAHGLTVLTPNAEDFKAIGWALKSVPTPSGETLRLDVLSFPGDAP